MTRPCPWAACRHHLLIESERSRGGLRVHPHARDVDPVVALFAMEHTCSLDAADEGPRTLNEVSELLGVTRERVRQIEEAALRKLGRSLPMVRLKGEAA